MFETYDSAEVQLPKELSPNGEHLWRYVQINIQCPWFYIEYSDVDLKSRSILELATNDQLMELFNDPGTVITEAHVVTPGHVNKTNGWQMNKLKQVVRATQKSGRGKIQVTIYVLSDGKEIVNGIGKVEKAKLEDCETVYICE